MDCSPPGSSVHGILQAKILEWVAIPFSRGSSQSRYRTCVSYTIADSFMSEPPGKPRVPRTSGGFWQQGSRAAESGSSQQGSPQPTRRPHSHHPEAGALPWINNILNVFYLYVNIHISLPFGTRLDLFILLNGFVNTVASVTRSPPPRLAPWLWTASYYTQWGVIWFWLYSFPIRREALSESYIGSNDFLFWECSHGGAILLIYLIWCAFSESLALWQNRWEGIAW